MNSFITTLSAAAKKPAPTVKPVAVATLTAAIEEGAKQMAEKQQAAGGVNWLALMVKALSVVPIVVAGIEHIHGDAMSGTDKKTLALESLGLSGAVAATVDPAHQQAISVATQTVSSAIDGVVAVMNAAKTKPPSD